MAWTKEQEQAIYTRGSSIIVSAGAGSGKTAVLSERILDYCLKGNDIRRVLVLTFTNAAAREMKERIRKKLKENKLYEAADYIDAAYITTFDAYSLALVKKYYYKLGLSKKLSIMDKALITIKRKEIIQQIFDEFYTTKDERFFSYLKKYTLQDDKQAVSIVEELCNKLDLIIDFDSFKNTYSQVYLSDEKLTRIIEEYEVFTKEELQEFILVLTDLYHASQADPSSEKLAISIEALLNDLNSFVTYEQFYQVLNSYSFPRMSPKASRDVKEFKEAANTILKNLKSTVFSKYVYKEDMYKELKSITPDTLFLLDVCALVSSRLLEYKKSIMSFDYSDIAKFSIQLVREHEDVRKDLKEYYKEILVDEYQDTSDLQEAFLTEIENNNLYMVGDIKQSIYRFRNANPYIFKDKYDRYSKGDGGLKIDLTYNFRSRSEVLNHINFVFNQLMTPSCGDANYILEHQMQYGLKAYDDVSQDVSFDLDILRYALDEYDGYSQEEIEAFITAKTILDTMDKHPLVFKGGKFVDVKFQDFAILIDKAKSFIIFKKIFEHLGIPLAIEADLDLKDSILPKLFSNIILIIYKLKNKIYDVEYKHALASLARSFIYEYTDQEIYDLIVDHKPLDIMDDLYSLANMTDISMTDLFYEICKKLGIYEKLSLIGDVDNSIVVLEYIYKMLDTLGTTSMRLDEISEYLTNVLSSDIKLPYRLESSGTDSVRIMTIHKSKGLEFAYCIFPLISSQFNKSEVRASAGFHAKYGIYIPYVDEGKSDTILKTLISCQILRADISERVRLLYVALTRAREKMICILPQKDKVPNNPKNFSSFYQMLFYCDGIESLITDIDLKEYNISSDYKKQKLDSLNLESKNTITYNPIKLPRKIEKEHISKRLYKLPDKNVRQSIELGLEFHSILEALDFKNPRIEELDISEFMKERINKVLALPVFRDIASAKVFQEHEFYFIENLEEYHGIIDLLVMYEDHMDIIDYKLSNVDSKEYERQLLIYKRYVSSISNLPIDVYLLSILKSEIKKLDI